MVSPKTLLEGRTCVWRRNSLAVARRTRSPRSRSITARSALEAVTLPCGTEETVIPICNFAEASIRVAFELCRPTRQRFWLLFRRVRLVPPSARYSMNGSAALETSRWPTSADDNRMTHGFIIVSSYTGIRRDNRCGPCMHRLLAQLGSLVPLHSPPAQRSTIHCAMHSTLSGRCLFDQLSMRGGPEEGHAGRHTWSSLLFEEGQSCAYRARNVKHTSCKPFAPGAILGPAPRCACP